MSESYIVVRPKLHTSQRTVFDHPARFKILACGRRWGKTRLASVMGIETAVGGGRVWWIGPTYPMASIGWRLLKIVTAPLQPDKSEVERRLTFPGGGEIWVKSADNPDSLRGEGLDLAIFDECAYIKEYAWTDAIRAALTDRKGGAVFISSPRGRNWYFRLWQAAKTRDDWESWQFPSSDNPFLDPDEIEQARDLLPDRTFRQEYLGEFIEDDAVVFPNVRLCIYTPDAKPRRGEHKGHTLVAGVDWGKQNDYTAMSIGCKECKREVALLRTRGVDYALQRKQIAGLYEYWKIKRLIAESNAMGEPNIEELRRAGVKVKAFATSGTSKPPLIENMILAFDKVEWQFLDKPEPTAELHAFERTISAHNSRPKYGAPAGMHDDTVIARALMLRAATTSERAWA